jgi:hypothetical protein
MPLMVDGGSEFRDILARMADLQLVRRRSTASLTPRGMNGTRWNASLPYLEAGAVWEGTPSLTRRRDACATLSLARH